MQVTIIRQHDQLTSPSVLINKGKIFRVGYHQTRIAEEEVPKIAFRMLQGLYEFRGLTLGLTNAPAAFQHEMNRIFGLLAFALLYLDAILEFSKAPEQHAEHLNLLLQLLRAEQQRPRDGSQTAPPPAMLLDGAEECQID